MDYVLECYDRMVNLWLDNRSELLHTRPKYPSSWKKQNYKSFIAFRNRQVRYNIPHKIFSKLSEPEITRLFNDQFPGRRVWHYNNRIENGKVIHEKFFKILPKGKLSDLQGKIRPEVRNALLIKPGKRIRLIGTVPFKYGCGPSKIRHQDKRIFKFLTDEKSIWKGSRFIDKYDVSDQERISVPGVWENQWMDIQECGKEKENEVSDYGIIREAIAARFKGNLYLPVCKKPKPDDCLRVETNPDAQTGIVCGKIFGLKHRDADKFMRPIAREVF